MRNRSDAQIRRAGCSPRSTTRAVYARASASDLQTCGAHHLLHSSQSMRVLGIDCGGEYTGYGVVEQDDAGSLCHICSGAIHLVSRDALELRLKTISDTLDAIIAL